MVTPALDRLLQRCHSQVVRQNGSDGEQPEDLWREAVKHVLAVVGPADVIDGALEVLDLKRAGDVEAFLASKRWTKTRSPSTDQERWESARALVAAYLYRQAAPRN